MKVINSLNFGFIAWLVAIKKFELIKINKQDGADIKIPDDIYQKDLKEEYNKSDYKVYNETLREIISTFKNS